MKDNYPMMTQLEKKNAPWNQVEPKSIKVKVCVSITLSKSVEVAVNDYAATEDMGEDGYPDINYDFSECNLKEAVNEQIVLPNEAYKFIGVNSKSLTDNIKKDLSNWVVDDYEVVLDE